MNKAKTPPTQLVPTPPAKSPDNPLAIVSMVLGVTSLTGPGFLLGIPAIITAIIALKKNNSSHGLSITGLVTGSISTVVSLLFGALIVWAIIWSINNPTTPLNTPAPNQTPQMFEGAET